MTIERKLPRSSGFVFKGADAGREFIAGPGDSWVHPRGVPHYSEALEDCVQIEVKSPPIRTWRLPGDPD